MTRFVLGLFIISGLFASEPEPLDFQDLISRNSSKTQSLTMEPSRTVHGHEIAWTGNGDFLYWQPIQENMEPVSLVTSAVFVGFTGRDAATILNMTADYKPAFAVGIGFLVDKHFDLNAEYTRFYSTQEMSRSGNFLFPMQLDAATLISLLDELNVDSGIGGAAPFSFEQTWNLGMNLLDLDFGRFQFEHKIVKIHPFVGARVAWISQELRVEYLARLINGGPVLATSKNRVHTSSWGVGIRGGIDMSCKLGAGFKFYGQGAGDLLYTQYNWHESSNLVVLDATRSADLSQKSIPTVRAHLDGELGLLWGRCFGKTRRAYFDIGAGYGFQVFFNQNMFRHFTSPFGEIGLSGGEPIIIGVIATPISNSPNGNLYLQGLRVHTSFIY